MSTKSSPEATREQEAEPGDSSLRPGWSAPLRVALLATIGVSLIARLLPDSWAATGVSAGFFLLCYWLVLRRSEATIARCGMRLGGAFEAAPLDPRRMLKESARALSWACLLGAVVFLPFWAGYVFWWSPQLPFTPKLGDHFLEEILGQVLVVALPEEMFYRGYLQTELDRALPPKRRLLGADVGVGVVLTSAVFALGHLATQPNLARLAVFFPSLLFGWLRVRTGGIGASVFFHALCNLFAAFLARSYGFLP